MARLLTPSPHPLIGTAIKKITFFAASLRIFNFLLNSNKIILVVGKGIP